MWFYVQMALPLLTVALAAAICFSVASFILQTLSLIRQPRGSQIGRQDHDTRGLKTTLTESGETL